ncbi:flagella synthesis protein FlgN [Niveibacterium sp.]|uniref:flagella synthesis protein FlgN n=1 Tax=Niveibacterium sp. TaxID=2017444 RepID=UPI0035AE5ECF
MNPTALLQAQFSALLAEVSGQLERFVRLLEDEHELLITGQIEALLSLAEDKTAAVRQLQQAENARALLLSRSGIDARAGKIAEFIAQLPEQTQRAWRHYLDLAARAQQLNLRNGEFIRDQLRANQQAMSVLLASTGPSLYDADGVTSSRPGGRLFGRA